jgi:site-specific DNA recombinase
VNIAAGYFRVSTDDQNFNRQVDAVRAYAAKNDYQLVAEFYDKESGANPDREQFLKLQEWVSQNPGTAVLAAELDRLSRGTEGWAAVTAACFKYNVKLMPLNIPHTGNVEADELMMDTLLAFAKYERRVITSRMYGGRIAKLRRGIQIWGSRVPYGYDYVPGNEVNKIVLNKEEAKVVRWIFDMYANKYYSLYEMVRQIHLKRVKTKWGKDIWQPITIKGMLKNTAYIGEIYFNKKKHKSRTQYKTVDKPREEWITIKVDPIIDKELFDKTQELLKRPRHQPTKLKWEYLLNRVIYCGVCGKRYNAYKAGNGYKYYRCSTRRCIGLDGKRMDCLNRVQRADQLDDYMWKWLVNLITSKKGKNTLDSVEKLEKARKGSITEFMREIEGYKKEQEATVNRREEAKEAFSNGKLKLDTFMDLESRINNRISELNRKIADVEVKLSSLATAPSTVPAWFKEDEFRIGLYLTKGKDLTLEKKREIAYAFINRITILPEKNKVKVEFNIPYTALDPNFTLHKDEKEATVVVQEDKRLWFNINLYNKVTLVKLLTIMTSPRKISRRCDRINPALVAVS